MKKLILLLSVISLISCSENDTFDPTAFNPNLSVVENLDNGVSAKSIADNLGVVSLQGLEYGGGHIFHVDETDWSLYVAVDYAEAGEMAWGDHFNLTNGKMIGDGESNTQEIVAENLKDNSNVPNGLEFGSDNYAFKFVEDLEYNTYNDWFIPSKDEANKIYEVLTATSTIVIDPSKFYWTSSKEGYEPYVISFSPFMEGEPFLGTCFASNHLLLVRKIENPS